MRCVAQKRAGISRGGRSTPDRGAAGAGRITASRSSPAPPRRGSAPLSASSSSSARAPGTAEPRGHSHAGCGKRKRPRGLPHGRFRCPSNGLFGLPRLDRDRDGHVVADVGRIHAHVEVRALDRGGSLEADPRLLQHRMLAHLGHRGIKDDRLGDAVHRQIAGDLAGLLAGHLDRGRLERDVGVLVGAEEVVGQEMRGALVPAGEQRLRREGHGDRAVGRLVGVEHDLAVEAREHPRGGREAEVAVVEDDLAVARVKVIFDRLGDGDGGKAEGKAGGEKKRFHAGGLRVAWDGTKMPLRQVRLNSSDPNRVCAQPLITGAEPATSRPSPAFGAQHHDLVDCSDRIRHPPVEGRIEGCGGAAAVDTQHRGRDLGALRLAQPKLAPAQPLRDRARGADRHAAARRTIDLAPHDLLQREDIRALPLRLEGPVGLADAARGHRVFPDEGEQQHIRALARRAGHREPADAIIADGRLPPPPPRLRSLRQRPEQHQRHGETPNEMEKHHLPHA
ncbi:hypothetical protein SDC9_36595 [bioreactor metagenome]|uniref:Uncharacterized protein n=1 Tax=bioreactor metagenome TaxID=1076179 RepID=A0A644VIQ2_9ZZZZ